MCSRASCCTSPSVVCAQQGAKEGQWRYYGGDHGTTKYAPLDQINRDNVKKLAVAWRWSSPENDVRRDNILNLFDLIDELVALSLPEE